MKGQALGAMPGALLCPLSQNFLSHIRLEGVAGQKVHFDFKSRRLTVLYWGDHSFAHLWEKPHSVNSVKSSSSGGSSEKRTDLTSDFSPLQAIPQSSPGCGGKDLPLSPHWWSEKRRYPSPSSPLFKKPFARSPRASAWTCISVLRPLGSRTSTLS